MDTHTMAHSTSWKGLKLETPTVYRIRVQGHLDSRWEDRLGGMAITMDSTVSLPPVSILEGQVLDQSALSGVLNTLYELHLPLLSVENMDEKQSQAKTVTQ